MINITSIQNRPYLLVAPALLLAALLGLLVTRGSLEEIALLTLGMVFVVAIFKRPALGAAAILAFAPLQGIITFPGLGTLTKAIAAVVGAVFLLLLLNKRLRLQLDNTFFLIIVFVVWALASNIWGVATGFGEWYSLVVQSLLYLLLVNLVLSRRDLLWAIRGYVLGGLILAAMMIRQTDSFLTRSAIESINTDSAQGINLSARLVGLGIILMLYLFVNSKTNRRITTVSFLAVTTIMGFAVLLSLSRGTWAAVIVGLLSYFGIMFLFSDQRRALFTKLIIPIGVGIFILWSMSLAELDTFALSRIMTRAESAILLTDNAGSRLLIWGTAAELIGESPLLGHGFAQAPNLLGLLHYGGARAIGAHNAFVRTVIEMGVIGLTLFVVIWISIGQKIIACLRPPERKIQTAALAASVFLYLLTGSMVDDSLHRHYLWFGWALVVLIIRYSEFANPDSIRA